MLGFKCLKNLNMAILFEKFGIERLSSSINFAQGLSQPRALIILRLLRLTTNSCRTGVDILLNILDTDYLLLLYLLKYKNVIFIKQFNIMSKRFFLFFTENAILHWFTCPRFSAVFTDIYHLKGVFH